MSEKFVDQLAPCLFICFIIYQLNHKESFWKWVTVVKSINQSFYMWLCFQEKAKLPTSDHQGTSRFFCAVPICAMALLTEKQKRKLLFQEVHIYAFICRPEKHRIQTNYYSRSRWHPSGVKAMTGV